MSASGLEETLLFYLRINDMPAPGTEMVPAWVCDNCLGAKYLGLEVAMSGPMETIPGVRPDDLFRAAWHNGAWWLVARNLYACPVCNPVRKVAL